MITDVPSPTTNKTKAFSDVLHSVMQSPTPSAHPPQKITKVSAELSANYSPKEYSIKFGTFGDTNKTVISIYDKQTNELVRQIPPEELLEMQSRLSEQTGNFVDVKA